MLVEVSDKKNKKWRSREGVSHIGFGYDPIVSKEDRIFAMGSCFAEEIRMALASKGFSMLPDYSDVNFDPSRVKIDELPNRPHMNYYNTYTILQEFQRHAGLIEFDADGFFVVRDKLWGSSGTICQDPYKRLVFGRNKFDLRQALDSVNSAIDKGIKSADVFIFTFGMTEVFRCKSSGLVACQKPLYAGHGNLDDTFFHQSGFSENLDNIQKLIDLINQEHDEAKVILSISPVPLERTFSSNDIYVANTEGKSILRAVAGEIVRKNSNAYYFPSYEIVSSLGGGAFEHDGRHVKRKVVQQIMNVFERFLVGS